MDSFNVPTYQEHCVSRKLCDIKVGENSVSKIVVSDIVHQPFLLLLCNCKLRTFTVIIIRLVILDIMIATIDL